MLIFNKKRIIFLMLATFLPVGMFMLQNTNNNLERNISIETMATPSTSKTIIIDAGHRTEKMEELYQKMELAKLI